MSDGNGIMKTIATVVTAFLVPVLCTAALGQGKPNIIFIMTDDMGYGDASCYNPDSVIKTPNIDRLAAQGMRFTDAHSPSSVCTPTRYGVLTGRYCWRSRLKRGVFGGYNTPLIERDRVTVASFLKEHGYRTACIGKWHLGWNWGTKAGHQPDWDYEQGEIDFSKPISHGPTDLGFDYFFGTSGCTTDDPPLCFVENNRTVGIPDRYAAEDPAGEGRRLMSVKGWRHEDADFAFMRRALDFIERATGQDKPFFVYLPLSVPHIPWFPHEAFKGKSGAGPRGDQVLMADHILGEIVRKLEALEISEKTLVIFTSDNGPREGINGHASAGQWRGYKGSIWEGGHRVPFIAKWPGKIRAGKTCEQTMALTDLLATSAALIGEKLPPGAGEDSYNILPALLGEAADKPIHDVTIHHSGAGVFAVRVGDWKLIWESEEAGYHDEPEPGSPGQLYKLNTDPGERRNLFHQRPNKVAELQSILARVQGRDPQSHRVNHAAGDWPQYLGPNRNGISSETGFDPNWSKQKPEVLWRQPLGYGFAGAALARGKVYVLDRVEDKQDVFRCFDLHTGQALWRYAYDDPGKYSLNGSRSAPTIQGDRAYCVGAMGRVHCFDLVAQKPVWSRDFREDFDAELPMWAYSQSPVVYGDLVIVAPQCEQAGVVAYHRDTGEIVWTTARLCDEAGYVSPTLATIDGVPQIIQVTPYISPDYIEPEEDEEEDEPEPSIALTGKTFSVELDNETYTFVFKSEDEVHIAGGLAGDGMDGEYWQEGEEVFMEIVDTLFMEGQYDGEAFAILEFEEIEEEDEDEEENEEDEGPGFAGGGVYGIDARTGKILWNYKGINCRWPIPPVTHTGDGRFLITAGYEAATSLIQVQFQGGRYQVQELFRNSEIQSQIHPAIFYDKHLFMIGNGNARQDGLMCVSMDGRVLWQTGRKPNFDRGGFLIADGKIFMVDGKRGDLYCARASSKGYQQLGKMKLLKGGKVWSPLALSQDMLVLRDQKQLVCVKLARGEDPATLMPDSVGAGHDQGIVATASSTDDAAEAINTINGSGLHGAVHDRAWKNTWTSDGGAGNPPAPSPNPARGEGQWIHYDLGRICSLGRMSVWNGNEVSERGLKRVTIDYAVDSDTWTELGTFEFPQAPESGRYSGFVGPDFGRVRARHVLLTIHSNHGAEFGYALSEISIAVGSCDAEPGEGKLPDQPMRPTELVEAYPPPDLQPVLTKAERFEALGNSDPDHRAPKRSRGEVVVTFDQLPTRMSFNLPSFPCLVTENKISYYNGWTETYDAAAGVGSCEPLMDHENQYSRMWIESQNDARIVVRWRAALVSNDGIIAHKDAPQVSPYGPGDWVDESYIIYPDGVHVRKSTIYTYFAPQAKPFGWDRDPPNYIFEFQEMLFLGQRGHLPEDDIHTQALTLIKMNGDHATISYDPYPVHFEPEEEELYQAFGDYAKANIFVVNTKSQYHPFTIGRTEGVSISPYAPERRTRKGIFQSWPQNPNREEGYGGTALGHIILRSFYERTDTSLTQIYLSGFTDSCSPHEELIPLGRSWLHAPAMELKDTESIGDCAYHPAQRAYLIDLKQGRGPKTFEFVLKASKGSPVVNPAFLINNWGKSDIILEVNGAETDNGIDFRLGYYPSLDVDGAGQWRDVLLVWVQTTSSQPVHVRVCPKLFCSETE